MDTLTKAKVLELLVATKGKPEKEIEVEITVEAMEKKIQEIVDEVIISIRQKRIDAAQKLIDIANSIEIPEEDIIIEIDKKIQFLEDSKKSEKA